MLIKKFVDVIIRLYEAEIDNIIYKVAHTGVTINKIDDVIEKSRAVK